MEFNIQIDNRSDAENICKAIYEKVKNYNGVKFSNVPKDGQILIWKSENANDLFHLIQKYNFRRVYAFCGMSNMEMTRKLNGNSRVLVYNTKKFNIDLSIYYFGVDLKTFLEDSVPSSSHEGLNVEDLEFCKNFEGFW